MSIGTYRGYLKSDMRTKSSLFKASSSKEALIYAAAIMASSADAIMLIKQIILICGKCSYKWKYCGYRRIYASCPQCMKQIKLKHSKGNINQCSKRIRDAGKHRVVVWRKTKKRPKSE